MIAKSNHSIWAIGMGSQREGRSWLDMIKDGEITDIKTKWMKSIMVFHLATETRDIVVLSESKGAHPCLIFYLQHRMCVSNLSSKGNNAWAAFIVKIMQQLISICQCFNSCFEMQPFYSAQFGIKFKLLGEGREGKFNLLSLHAETFPKRLAHIKWHNQVIRADSQNSYASIEQQVWVWDFF